MTAQLFEGALGVGSPWHASRTELDAAAKVSIQERAGSSPIWYSP